MIPLGLLQELHLWFTLSCIPKFTSDESLTRARKHVYHFAPSARISLKMIAFFLTIMSSLITGATLQVGNALMSSQHQASR